MFVSDFSTNHAVKEWHRNLFYPVLRFLYNLKHRHSAVNLTDLNWSYIESKKGNLLLYSQILAYTDTALKKRITLLK